MKLINHQTLNEVKTVTKPWGCERWIQAGDDNHTYVLKEIELNTGFRTSIQVHKHKAETNFILEGRGELWYYPKWFDCNRYELGGYTNDELNFILSNLECIEYGPGSTMTIEPGTIHRMVAVTDLRFVESSTCHLDDVIRLQDDSNRSHGKIDSEHQ